MKTLLLLRHGNAQHNAPAGDKARTLTKRGEHDVAAMARQVRDLVGCPDAIISSDAVRAHQTALIVARVVGFPGEATTDPAIYDASLSILLRVVCGLSDDTKTVLLIGHNPGFEHLAAALSQPRTLEPLLPTAALAHLEFDLLHWRDAREGSGRLLEIYTPRGLSGES